MHNIPFRDAQRCYCWNMNLDGPVYKLATGYDSIHHSAHTAKLIPFYFSCKYHSQDEVHFSNVLRYVLNFELRREDEMNPKCAVLLHS